MPTKRAEAEKADEADSAAHFMPYENGALWVWPVSQDAGPRHQLSVTGFQQSVKVASL